MSSMAKFKPKGAWQTAKLYKARFFEPRLPLCGSFLVWAIVGYKWVRIMSYTHTTKFKMSRKLWDDLKVCNPYTEPNYTNYKEAA